MQVKDQRWHRTDAGHHRQLDVATKALELYPHINAIQTVPRALAEIMDLRAEVQGLNQGQAAEEKQEEIKDGRLGKTEMA